VSWKPKPPSPESPSFSGAAAAGASAETGEGGGAVKAGGSGMSASDAKESIGRGGSLKDRMAALQGRGAFGAPAAPAAPVVGTGKKWVPPPKPPPVEEEEAVSPPATTAERGSGDEPTPEEPDKPEGEPAPEAEGEADPEEEERKRRAGIAARMARLGGARVGMAPPVFGPKPTIKKRTSEDAQSVKSQESAGGLAWYSNSIRFSSILCCSIPAHIAAHPCGRSCQLG
jgi:hypothetical protein